VPKTDIRQQALQYAYDLLVSLEEESRMSERDRTAIAQARDYLRQALDA
jgi:hypothetical protein